MRDAAQMDRVIEQYGDMVRRIGFLYLKNSADADDMFQEVFLKYMLYSGDFETGEHEKAWLIRVSVNRCKDTLRSAWRRLAGSLEEAREQTVELQLPAEASEVYEAVAALPAKYRSIVYLHYYEGYSAVEIASILGKSPNTVYTWLARAKKLLRQQLGGEGVGA